MNDSDFLMALADTLIGINTKRKQVPLESIHTRNRLQEIAGLLKALSQIENEQCLRSFTREVTNTFTERKPLQSISMSTQKF